VPVQDGPLTAAGTSRFTRRPTWLTWASGVPEMALGAAFFVTWVDPDRFGRSMVSFALELMLLEFILIHSAGFMAAKTADRESIAMRIAGIGGLGLFYSLFVGAFCLALHRIRPLVSFWVVTTQRIAGDVLDPKPSDETRAWFGTSLAVNIILYVGIVTFTVLVPLPPLGITPDVARSVGIHGSGLWQAQPQTVVVLAGAYYGIRGLLTATAWPRRAMAPDRAAAGQVSPVARVSARLFRKPGA
jgi:hypothetical protein